MHGVRMSEHGRINKNKRVLIIEQLVFLEILLYIAFRVRFERHAGWNVLRMLDPQFMVDLVLRQQVSYFDQLLLVRNLRNVRN